jgi:hypothetical protein
VELARRLVRGQLRDHARGAATLVDELDQGLVGIAETMEC